MIRSGPPEPPRIFIGSATTSAPFAGSEPQGRRIAGGPVPWRISTSPSGGGHEQGCEAVGGDGR
jgi:hypothetical protein